MAKTSAPQKKGKAKPATASNRRKVRAVDLPGTKAERIAMLLERPEGAPLDEMMKATGWQAHSVRGFMSGTLVKKKGLTITSDKVDGQRRYRIVMAGATA